MVTMVLLAGCGGQNPLRPLAADARIVAFGDSLTHGTGVQSSDAYPAVLARLTGREVVESGIPGEISSAGLERLPAVLAAERPALVIICHGGNDVLRRMNPSATASNLRAMVRLVREHGADAVLVAVPRPGLIPSAYGYYDDLADELDVPVEFEIIANLMSDRRMKSDPVHFNRQGYERLAQAVHGLLVDAGALSD